MLVPVPTKVPPQEPEYHFQSVLEFKLPEPIDKVIFDPEQMELPPEIVGVLAGTQIVTVVHAEVTVQPFVLVTLTA